MANLIAFNRAVAYPNSQPGGKVTEARVTVYVGNETLSCLIGEDNIVLLIADLAKILSEMKRDAKVYG